MNILLPIYVFALHVFAFSAWIYIGSLEEDCKFRNAIHISNPLLENQQKFPNTSLFQHVNEH